MVIQGDNGHSIYGKNLLGYGRRAVTTAGERVSLATDIKGATGVYIKAMATNTGLIYVGDITVTSANGFPLSAGDQLFLPISSTSSIFLDSAVNGGSVAYFIV